MIIFFFFLHHVESQVNVGHLCGLEIAPEWTMRRRQASELVYALGKPYFLALQWMLLLHWCRPSTPCHGNNIT